MHKQTFAVLHRPGSHPAPPYQITGEVQPFVGQDLVCVESLSDESLRSYEAECFNRCETAATKDEKHVCVHEVARCIVEMTNRGMSLKGSK